MTNLIATALLAFSLALVVFGLVAYFRGRVRNPRALIPTGIGALFILGLLAAQVLGAPLLGSSLQEFAQTNLLVLGAGVVGALIAVGLAFFASRRPWAAWGALFVLGLAALGALYFIVPKNASQTAAVKAGAPEHPSLAQIQVPKGFKVQTFAQDLQEPNALAFDGAGNLYYAEAVDGNIVRLRDTNGDGTADEKKVFASGFKNPRGLVWHDGTLYVSHRGPIDAPSNPNNVFIGQISTLRDTNGDGVADENKIILDKLFSLDIQHSNNGITFGADGKLYLAIGGPRVGQLELKKDTYWYQGQTRDDWQFGGVLQMDADGKNPKLWARGLRNPYALAFGANGKLYATDNGDETIPVPDGDELNLVVQGADYGYPYFFGYPPPWSGTRSPIMRFEPHAAPTGVVVYDAPMFPEAYRGNVLTALYWHGQPGSHYRQLTRTFQTEEDGKKVWKTVSLIEGLDRPTALAVGSDGALYIADMRGGKADADFPGAIYRVTYDGKE